MVSLLCLHCNQETLKELRNQATESVSLYHTSVNQEQLLRLMEQPTYKTETPENKIETMDKNNIGIDKWYIQEKRRHINA